MWCCWYILWFATMMDIGDLVYSKTSCFPFNPLILNTTTPSPDVTTCPEKCKCEYCRYNLAPGGKVITYEHRVDCSSVGLSKVPSETLPIDAKMISLSGNKIAKLSADTFKRTPNLRTIDLSANILDHVNIDDNAFRGLKKLEKLQLSNNRAISNVRRAWFEPLISLKHVKLSTSHVSNVEENVFHGLQNLSTVALNSNKINNIHPRLFHGLPNLQRIILQDNSIQTLPNMMFLDSPDVVELNVASNQITEISKQVHLQNLTKLNRLSVQLNPYACNCDILWLRAWLNTTSADVLKKDNITCASGPAGVVNKNIMKFDKDILNCEPRIMMIVIVTCSTIVVIGLMASFIYYFRWSIRFWYQRQRLRRQYESLTKKEAPPLNQCIKYDAFISYNSNDQEWVTKVLQPTLEAPPHNMKLCVDYRDFLVGEAIAQNIANSVRSSRKTVLVITKNFVHSEWCNFELEMAHSRMFEAHEDVLVTILLEDVKVSTMPLLLQRVLKKRTYIEWPNEEGRKVFWIRLARAIGSPNIPLQTSRICIN